MKSPTKTINKYGDIKYRLNGFLHRTDGPAIEYVNGSKEWYVNGERHRIDGPAIERVDGNKWWCINGKYHRTDGYKEWLVNNKRITMGNHQSFVNDYPDLINQFLAYQVLNG